MRNLYLFFSVAILGLGLIMTSCKLSNNTTETEFTIEGIETGKYLKAKFESKEGDLNYRILYPDGFDPEKKYPVFLFLHGAGERGGDNEAQLVHGRELIKKGMNTHQSIAIFPQCPEGDFWVRLKQVEVANGQREFAIDVNGAPSKAQAGVIELMKFYAQNEYVDPSRIYVSGLSMGGMGTFDLCWRMPEFFAAAAPICGAGEPTKAKDYSQLPMRIFHGDADQVVSVDESKTMISALQEAGGSPDVFIYPDVNHNSWDNAFAEPDFLSWFFEHKR